MFKCFGGQKRKEAKSDARNEKLVIEELNEIEEKIRK
jgi:hypothetical protein